MQWCWPLFFVNNNPKKVCEHFQSVLVLASSYKPRCGFYLSAKSQMIGDFVVSRQSQILLLPTIGGDKSLDARKEFAIMNFSGFERPGLVPKWSPMLPDSLPLYFDMFSYGYDHRRKLGRVGKTNTLPIFYAGIYSRPFQMIWDVCNFMFQS